MVKNFKEVRNVLNMKKIVTAGVLAGTLFGSTSAFAAGGATQSHDATKYSNQSHSNIGLGIFQNQYDADFGSQLQSANSAKKSTQRQNLSLLKDQTSVAGGALIAQLQGSASSSNQGQT